MQLDTDIPAGNGIIEDIHGSTIHLRPDLRDTEGHWFYWHVRLTGAAGRCLRFVFLQEPCLSSIGPAVSEDAGRSWRWLGHGLSDVEGFELEVPTDVDDLRLSMGMPYAQPQLDAWLAGLPDRVRCERLCISRAGRDVPLLRFGAPPADARLRVLLCARHHACEMMASYALESLVEKLVGAVAGSGHEFAEQAAFYIVPFTDMDGVVEGDQGKNRRPHDHNRDYVAGNYRETTAIRSLIADSAGPDWLCFDLHCPYIRNGNTNEQIYQVGSSIPHRWARQQEFGRILEQAAQGPLSYSKANDLPHGVAWNTVPVDRPPTSFGHWTGSQFNVCFTTTLEIPYAVVDGIEVVPESLRIFGRELADAICGFEI